MKRILLICISATLLFSSCFTEKRNSRSGREDEEKDGYDNALIREKQEAERTKDPALGFVPYYRLYDAINRTEQLKNTPSTSRTYLPLTWEERGPIYDSVGPSNGNGRGGGTGSTAGGYTSGRIRAFLLDTLNDVTGNTAFCAGVAGGVWRCTNFLSVAPNWVPINDNFSNLAISSFCQDPTNPQTIYFATGEPTSNADAVYGKGVWKSTDGGLSFSFLPSTSNFLRNYKIDCDVSGNLYLACRITTIPIAQSQGLFRSANGGTSWVDITPNDLTAGNNTCTDFVFTASGILNATFGYLAPNNLVNQRYTASPATVTPSTWSAGTGFRVSNAAAIRVKLASYGEVLYAITVNTAYNTDSCYKSVNGGATWTKQNTTVLPAGLGNGQGWYSMSLAINPSNTNELISGGLDAFRSTNSGATWTKFTNWVSTAPYVHADHHFAGYWITGGQTRMIMTTDGGIFYSTDNGATFKDKNKNLGIKQFYSAAIHPAAGSPYLLAGAQDNGTHQLKNPGLSYSIEVTGGDGCIVHINQLNPQIQFGSYVYNQYRRSTNGGNTWSSVNLSTTVGLFVNPFDYDDAQNIMYCSNGPVSQIRRWPNANTATASTSITFANATLGAATVSLTAFKVSPFTTNRVYFGTNNGKLFRLDNANTVTNATVDANTTNIGSASFTAGATVSCVNTGTDDNNLIAVFSNYGVSNVWITTNGGTSWTAIDGNLPDMPVRWAMFEPGTNEKIYLATEAGVYTTTNINGASTQWLPENGFPTVRTDMLKMRTSDSTIVAGTHGRGLWTAKIPPCGTNSISAQPQNTAVCAGSNAVFNLSVSGPAAIYQWQVSTDGGGSYTDIPGATSSTLTLTAVTASMNGYKYRVITDTYCSGLLTSDPGTLTVNTAAGIATCTSNVVVSNTVNQCGAIVNYPPVTTTGSPAPTVSYSTPSGSFFPVGTTTVTATATNICGVATCSFTVKVNDTQLPAITCPSNITATTPIGSCTAIVNYTVTASDNCPGVTINRTAGPASGTAFPLGTTTITHVATDASGNISTCSFTITVNDGQLPVISQQPQTTTVCAGSNAVFSVTSSNVQSYQWQAWNGSTWNNISGATSSSYTVNNVTSVQNDNSYRIIITGLCTVVTSDFATLHVNALPSVHLQASIPPSLLPTQALTITAIVNPGGGTFVWYKNGVIIPGASSSSLSGLTVDNIGIYKVVYTDLNGCTSTSEDLEVVGKSSSGLFIYPNPNNGHFQIRFYNQPGEKATVRVFDAKGATIYERSFVTTVAYTRIDIDLGAIKSSGGYVVEVVNAQGKEVGSKRILVVPAR